MARVNTKKTVTKHTHEGAPARHINVEQELRRSVMACMLWENGFYESGQTIADRIADLVPAVDPAIVAQMARECRSNMKLRHAPLWMINAMVGSEKHRPFVKNTLIDVVQRPDELNEFLAMYWKDGKRPIAASVKKGLAAAFGKFNEYQLAKWNRKSDIRLRDVMFLVHPKPVNVDQEALWKRLADDKLATPDTWEVSLSKSDGVDKKTKWERLLHDNKLSAMALLRNLRNMVDLDVNRGLIIKALNDANYSRVLPFRFIAAAIHAPALEPYLEDVMLDSFENHTKIDGNTAVLIDVSGSMDWHGISAKSDMRNIDVACGLGVFVKEMFSDVRIFTFSNDVVEVPARRGFALRDAIDRSQYHSGTYLGNAVRHVQNAVPGLDRLIVITDEQSHDRVPNPKCKRGYMINVASNKNGVGYAPWVHIDGFSEAILNYICEYESFTEK